MTKLLRLFLAVLALCPLGVLSAFGQSSVSILNNDGTITASGGNDLTLSNSTLFGVSDLGMGDDCGGTALLACSGTVTLTTGHGMSAGSSLLGNATWGSGGTIMVVSNSGAAGGFTFTGSFSSVTWTEGTTPKGQEFWTLIGTIGSGTLTLKDGQAFNIASGATINLTTVGGHSVNSAGFNTWTDAGGTTTFPSPVPEPGTLTLLGSGLVGLGFFARRLLARKTVSA